MSNHQQLTQFSFFQFISISKNMLSNICFNTTVSKLHAMLFICSVMFHAKIRNCTTIAKEKKLNWIASNKISSAKLFALLCSSSGSCINISWNLLIRQKYIEKNLCNRKHCYWWNLSWSNFFSIFLVHDKRILSIFVTFSFDHEKMKNEFVFVFAEIS